MNTNLISLRFLVQTSKVIINQPMSSMCNRFVQRLSNVDNLIFLLQSLIIKQYGKARVGFFLILKTKNIVCFSPKIVIVCFTLQYCVFLNDICVYIWVRKYLLRIFNPSVPLFYLFHSLPTCTTLCSFILFAFYILLYNLWYMFFNPCATTGHWPKT